MKFKTVIAYVVYWSTLIGPIYDILVAAYKELRAEVLAYSSNRRLIEEIQKMKFDNEEEYKS